MIFVCAHGDLFHPSVPDEWIDQVFAVMALAGHHTFQVLTKQAQRAADYFAHPVREALIGRQVGQITLRRTGSHVSEWSGLPLPNVWIGVSAEDQTRANERVPLVLRIPAAVRFLSLEPLLGPIDLNHIEVRRAAGVEVFSAIEYDGDPEEDLELGTVTIDWVIVGGESGSNARSTVLGHAKEIVHQCQAAGVAVHVKQLGARPTNREGVPHPITDKKGAVMADWPAELRVREFPVEVNVPRPQQ